MSDNTDPQYGVLEFRIALRGDIEIDAGDYGRQTTVLVSGYREGTPESAQEWTAEELCFWITDRTASAGHYMVNHVFYLEVFYDNSWREIKLIDPVPDLLEYTQDNEPTEEDFEAICPGPCGQLADHCTCDDIVAGTRLTTSRRSSARR